MPRKPRFTPPADADARLATFKTWLTDAAAWLEQHHDALGYFPPPLFPSRLVEEANAWAFGRVGRSPEQLVTAWVECQRRYFQRQLRRVLQPQLVTGDGAVLTLRTGAALANHDRTAVYAPH